MSLLPKPRLRSSIATAQRFYTTTQPKYQASPAAKGEPYWKHLSTWKDVEEKDFLTYGWQVRHHSLHDSASRLIRPDRKPTPSTDEIGF